MRNIRLLLQYEGTRYQGWQKQESSENTIQGKLEALLTKMCGEKTEIQGSGRTDAAAHAMGQVANFHTSSLMSIEEIVAYMNRYLPEDIAVLSAKEVPERFHSRLNAKGKCYIYQVINSDIPDIFLRRYALEQEGELDLEAMRAAAGHLVGEHDFKGFTSARKGKKPTVRKIDEITIEKKGHLITFTFRGNGFLYHMIRIIMGTLLETGRGVRDPHQIKEILKEGIREKAGALVPAKGLTLMEVIY